MKFWAIVVGLVLIACTPHLVDDWPDTNMSDYEAFWTEYHRRADMARACASPNDLGRFLLLAPHIQGNAELGEGFSEDIENIFIANSSCFCEALKLVSNEAKSGVRRRLTNPLFHSEEEIAEILSKHAACR